MCVCGARLILPAAGAVLIPETDNQYGGEVNPMISIKHVYRSGAFVLSIPPGTRVGV